MRWKALLVVGFVLLIVATTWSSVGTMSVQVKSTPIRSTPSFLGKVVATINYGNRVEGLQQQGDWIEVRSGANQEGWIHQSALTTKQVTLNAGGQNVKTGASGDEIALAGKGFNADVEAEYRAEHRNLDYTWVNQMEEINVTPRQMVTFLDNGGVHPVNGGAQ